MNVRRLCKQSFFIFLLGYTGTSYGGAAVGAVWLRTAAHSPLPCVQLVSGLFARRKVVLAAAIWLPSVTGHADLVGLKWLAVSVFVCCCGSFRGTARPGSSYSSKSFYKERTPPGFGSSVTVHLELCTDLRPSSAVSWVDGWSRWMKRQPEFNQPTPCISVLLEKLIVA